MHKVASNAVTSRRMCAGNCRQFISAGKSPRCRSTSLGSIIVWSPRDDAFYGTSPPKRELRHADLQSRETDQRLQMKQRLARAPRLMVDRHRGAEITICHPGRERLRPPFHFDFDLIDVVNAVASRNGQLTPAEKRVEWIMHGHDTRIAGIKACRIRRRARPGSPGASPSAENWGNCWRKPLANVKPGQFSCPRPDALGRSRISAGRIPGSGTRPGSRGIWCFTWHATNAVQRSVGRRESNTPADCSGTRISRQRSATCTSTTGSWLTRRIW